MICLLDYLVVLCQLEPLLLRNPFFIDHFCLHVVDESLKCSYFCSKLCLFNISWIGFLDVFDLLQLVLEKLFRVLLDERERIKELIVETLSDT